jgi:uncharacterized protein YgiM (DUF1202 family)
MILSKSKTRLRGVVPALTLMLGLLAGQAALAQSEQVIAKRVAQLRETSGETGRVLMAVPAQTVLTRLGERQGPWVRVRMADGATGWLHMFDITTASSGASANSGTGALRSLSSFFNKGSAQAPGGNVATSTVGIRGLGAEELNNATPNLAAVAQADAARLDAAQARQFAAMASLSSRPVEALPVPAAPPAASTRQNQNSNQNNTELFSR